MVAVHDLLEALASSGITVEANGSSLRYRPASAITPNLLAAVKSCKDELLELLVEPAHVVPTPGTALFSHGPGAGSDVATPTPARTAPVAPVYSTTQAPNKADIEWDRFLACAIPTPNGLGLYDPVNGTPEVSSGFVLHPSERPAGVVTMPDPEL